MASYLIVDKYGIQFILKHKSIFANKAKICNEIFRILRIIIAKDYVRKKKVEDSIVNCNNIGANFHPLR